MIGAFYKNLTVTHHNLGVFYKNFMVTFCEMLEEDENEGRLRGYKRLC